VSESENREPIILSNNGQKIFGVLHLPKAVSNPPCILICHGLGGHKTGRYRIYVDLAEALIKRGIASFRFDFRGSGDSEGEFSEVTLTGEVEDALKAFDYLKTETRIDRDRIGVFGRSMGGAVAVMSSASTQQAKSMALWAPMYNGDDWRHMWDMIQSGQASEQESQEMRRINGQVASMDFYAEMFKMKVDESLLKLSNIPLLLMHGVNDEVIRHAHSEQYMALRKHAEAPTKFIPLPHADHDFTHAEERKYAIELTSDWFLETLS
jgi:dipeptidyl aminopeptidase/acylaminoacyl peptidase